MNLFWLSSCFCRSVSTHPNVSVMTTKPHPDHDKRARREIANSNERRRMQSINAGFHSLRTLIPHSDGDKMSKVCTQSKALHTEWCHFPHVSTVITTQGCSYTLTACTQSPGLQARDTFPTATADTKGLLFSFNFFLRVTRFLLEITDWLKGNACVGFCHCVCVWSVRLGPFHISPLLEFIHGQTFHTCLHWNISQEVTPSWVSVFMLAVGQTVWQSADSDSDDPVALVMCRWPALCHLQVALW